MRYLVLFAIVLAGCSKPISPTVEKKLSEPSPNEIKTVENKIPSDMTDAKLSVIKTVQYINDRKQNEIKKAVSCIYCKNGSNPRQYEVVFPTTIVDVFAYTHFPKFNYMNLGGTKILTQNEYNPCQYDYYGPQISGYTAPWYRLLIRENSVEVSIVIGLSSKQNWINHFAPGSFDCNLSSYEIPLEYPYCSTSSPTSVFVTAK
jgi:hypothetical protein